MSLDGPATTYAPGASLRRAIGDPSHAEFTLLANTRAGARTGTCWAISSRYAGGSVLSSVFLFRPTVVDMNFDHSQPQGAVHVLPLILVLPVQRSHTISPLPMVPWQLPFRGCEKQKPSLLSWFNLHPTKLDLSRFLRGDSMATRFPARKTGNKKKLKPKRTVRRSKKCSDAWAQGRSSQCRMALIPTFSITDRRRQHLQPQIFRETIIALNRGSLTFP